MKRLAIAVLVFFALAGTALGQGVIFNDQVQGPSGLGISGATVTVCTSAGTGTPCTPTTPIYTSSALTTQISNPTTTDAHGNYSFWIVPGTYIVTITGTGLQSFTKTITPGCIPGATGCASGGSLNINGSPVTSPNLNGTTPSADSGFTAATFKVSGSNAIAEVPSLPSTLTAVGVYTIAPACGTQTNCLQLVDDNATDNCGTPLTTFLAAVNAYSGPGEPQVLITGSGVGKAYKFATAGCHLEFDIPTVVHDFATINCAQAATTANCVQFSPNNLVAQAAIPKFDWDGGVFTGGANLTNSIFECEPFTTNCVIHNVEFHNAGAGAVSGGVCTNWAIEFDPHVFEGTVAYTQWDFNDSVVGRCGYVNNTASGSNTVFYAHNTLGGGQGNGIPPTVCSNVGIFEGGFYGAISYNNLYGFNADIRTIGVGTRIDHNTLDSAECTLSGINAPIQYGGTGTANAVLQHSIEQNNLEGAHNTFLLAKAGDTGASTITDFTVIGNQGSNDGATPPTLVDSSNCLISNVTSGTACPEIGNVGITGVVSTASTNTGWCLGTVCGQFFQGSNAANIGPSTVVTTPYGTSWLVTCSVVLTRVATTSSTLPTCTIGWTDSVTSAAQSEIVTSTWASGALGCSGSTTNTLGNSCQGTTAVFAKTTTNITVTTSGYASSGATAMQYQVLVQVIGRP